MRVIASTDKWIASGSCVLVCPQVFGQRDEDGGGHSPEASSLGSAGRWSMSMAV